MRIVIGGKVYQGKAIDALSIKQALQFDRYCAENGYSWRWTDIERARGEIMLLTSNEERRRHPSALMMTALTVWATRIAEGDDVTFDEVISVPLESMAFLADPGELEDDDEVEEAAPDPPRARPASGRAGGSAAGKGKRKTTTTSGKTSRPASTRA